SVSGFGPVAGADLVANAVKSYAVNGDVRAANSPTPVTGQTNVIEVEGGAAAGDGLGGAYLWNPSSVAPDDNRTVLKPNSVSAAGRWLRLYELGQPTIFLKPNDQQVVSSTVLVNDSALTLSLLSGATYRIRALLQLQGSGGTGQGYKIQAAYSGTMTINGGGGLTTGNGTTTIVNIPGNDTTPPA